ncbi:MAG TPA: hypothetical protein VK846_18350, partial [Candidatus Limnocylindria bacterium]|nr:hypothetical protein [Candidatus Limnocylindria bacterium]
DSLFLIQEMANPEAMDTLISARIERRLPTPASDDYTPIDLAVQTYLDAPALLEEVHNEHQLTRPRSFEYFQALAGGHHPEEVLSEEFDTSPPAPLPIGCGEGSDGWDAEGEASGEPPDMTGGVFPDGHPALPTAEKLRVLEARLNEWFIAHRRGGNCRVFLYPKRDEWWFLVRHGLPRKRENVIKDDGESATVLIRPQKHDVVVYDSSTGELRMHCCNQRELEEFRRAFGQHLFGDEDFFPRGEKYRPTPLINDGPASLVCSDIEGLERVTLREVAFCFRINGHEVVHRAENIFALVEQGIIRWPSIWCIGRATFEVKFADSRKTRRLTLIAPNRALYGRDEDSGLIDEWLKARGFAAQREENETDSLAVA